MKGKVKILPLFVLLLICCLFAAQTSWPQQSEKSLLLRAMEEELQRSMKGLGEKSDPPPYFISYQITETEMYIISASYGALRYSSSNRSRLLDVEVRVGDYQLDNSHRLRGRYGNMRGYGGPKYISLDNNIDAIKSVLWLETDSSYKNALERLIQVKADKTVKVKEEDESADFSRESATKFIGPLSKIPIVKSVWEKKLKELSKLFNSIPEIINSDISLSANGRNKYFVNSEGSIIQQGATSWRLSLFVSTKAEDGMDLYRFESFDSHTLNSLPDEETIQNTIKQMTEDLLALRNAPVIEPYSGPAILTGRASAVFFHEIFGHRIEGHRQKDEREGQTYAKKVGETILPDFISVYDDPTIKRLGNNDLGGYYLYDDEGVKAQRVTIVENGILKNFLMSRSPISGFDRSNGHGRKQTGYKPVSRQGNLIIESSKTVSEKKLRELLIQECKKQDKPFGFIFKDISGGFTFTGRGIPQSYAVVPIMVYRVYSDGRPDELIRGADLIGTPLVSFSKIIACSDKIEVFNGMCGAESGRIPVSGISPSILTKEIEIQKKEKSSERPPLLPPPIRRIK